MHIEHKHVYAPYEKLILSSISIHTIITMVWIRGMHRYFHIIQHWELRSNYACKSSGSVPVIETCLFIIGTHTCTCAQYQASLHSVKCKWVVTSTRAHAHVKKTKTMHSALTPCMHAVARSTHADNTYECWCEYVSDTITMHTRTNSQLTDSIRADDIHKRAQVQTLMGRKMIDNPEFIARNGSKPIVPGSFKHCLGQRQSLWAKQRKDKGQQRSK